MHSSSNPLPRLPTHDRFKKFPEYFFCLAKYPRFWKFNLDFCPLLKIFEIFCRDIVNHLSVNYLWPKFEKICEIFFLAKIPAIFKISVGFLSTLKGFWNFWPKYRESALSKLLMTEVSKHLRNFFFPKIPPILEVKLDFCPLRKVFEIFGRNIVNQVSVSYFWLKF